MAHWMGSAQARELGDELRMYREEADVPAAELAGRLGWSASKLSRVESGQSPVDEVDVVRYGAHCGMGPDDIDEVLALCREPSAAGLHLAKRTGTLIFHENKATSSSSYSALIVPGLLQTEEYAAAFMGPSRMRLVSVRMERQRLLGRRPFEFFLHEQALRLPVGGNRVMNEQLLKLVLVAEQPNITVRVVPAALGARSVFGTDFVLFRYLNHPSLVYLEHLSLAFFVDDPLEVAEFGQIRNQLGDTALGGGESREMLAALASEFDRPEDSPDAPDQLAEEQFQRRT